MSPTDIAERHVAERKRLIRAVEREGLAAWRGVDRDAIAASWASLSPRVIAALVLAQRASAGQAEGYTAAMLAELGIDNDPAGEVVPDAFAGESADGRPLGSLMLNPVVHARQQLARGQSLAQAMSSGQAALQLMLRTEVTDAGRVADGVAVAARPRVVYTRYATPPSCPRCVILAGRTYRYSQGFQRHPGCFPAGVAVSGPSTLAATRRRYEGELVIISTASGKELPATGNHPILTNRGWLPANLLQEGDDVIGRASGQRAQPLVVPDEHQMPSRIEDVWSSTGMVPFLQMPTTAEDFHGDGGDGEVDVVFADSLLRDRREPALSQPSAENALAFGLEGSGALSPEGHATSLLVGALAPTSGLVGRGGLREALLGAHLGGADLARIGHAADLDACALQTPPDHIAADVVAEAEAVLALTRQILGGDVTGGEIDGTPTRWDAPASPFALESRVVYASRGKDLLSRLSGQVEPDRIVELRRVQWSGHVYNLTSAEGWYDANGLIVSNCDCVMQPSTEKVAEDLISDPRAAFERGQIRGLSKADAKAIEDGADVSQVVNAHRGMYTAGIGTRGRVKLTTEGTTRRGIGSRSRRLFDPGATEVTQRSGRRTVRRVIRPRPEQIYKDATSRQDAIRLLRLHGYLG